LGKFLFVFYKSNKFKSFLFFQFFLKKNKKKINIRLNSYILKKNIFILQKKKMNILVAKHIFGENYRQCKSKFPEDILFIIAEYAIDEIELEIIRINATMPNLHKYYLSTYNFSFYSYSKPYDETVAYNIRVKNIELLKSICDVIEFAYEKKPSTSKCKLTCNEKHEIERNVAGNFFLDYGIGTSKNYVSKLRKGGYVSRDAVILAFIIAGYEYKFIQNTEPFIIHGKRRNIGTRTSFIKRQKELNIPPSYLKFNHHIYGKGSYCVHISEALAELSCLTNTSCSYSRAAIKKRNKLIEFYNLHYPEKAEKPVATLEACGSTMLSINPENLKPLAGGGGGGCGINVCNFFGAKK
jgi:hypothetical protein